MGWKDWHDRLHLLGLVAVLAALGWLLMSGAPGDSGARTGSGVERAMEREMAYQARVAFLEQIYGPVEEMRRQGSHQQALLRLEQLNRQYAGEAHGFILRGLILHELGVLDEAAANFVRGLRINGDYVDERSPLSQRAPIQALVDEGHERLSARARANPDNPSVVAALRNVYYLQSRLAGGCE
ncbi:hypothetical protein [Geoalkalibacter halelectricus]|uniref:hypothetical protein n=1 Tax=Geoalkalibacter halelectricus TaxID=2847045 RepID=UPI003D1BB214